MKFKNKIIVFLIDIYKSIFTRSEEARLEKLIKGQKTYKYLFYKTYIGRIYGIIRGSKFIFQEPKKCQFLIYDKISVINFLDKFFDINKMFILDTRKESINIVILIKTLFKYKFKWSAEKYFDQIIKIVNPKIIITTMDNNINFLRLKKRFNYIITVFVQNGFRSIDADLFGKLNKLKNKKESYEVDKMFVFSEAVGKEYSKHIKGQIISSGSLVNNHYKIKNNFSDNNILFISEWSPYTDFYTTSPKYYEKHFSTEPFLLPLLSDFANSKKMKLHVLGRPHIYKAFKYRDPIKFPLLHRAEYKFYFDILGHANWKYINASISRSEATYNVVDRSKIIVSMNSTLGYESLARGKKTAMFCCKGQYLDYSPGYKFAWPADLPESGPFWTSSTSNSEFERVMNYLSAVKQEEWLRVSNSYMSHCMEYNKNNSKFINEMKNLDVPLKTSIVT